MDSPAVYPKHMAAVPPHLVQRKTPTTYSSSPLRPSARTSVNAAERERLTASIVSSSTRRQPIDLESLEAPKVNGHGSYSSESPDEYLPTPTTVARDPRDEAPSQTTPAVSRSASSYTVNRPIDFDGLSWPSKSWPERGWRTLLKSFFRSWYERASGSHTQAGRRALTEIGRSRNDHLGMYRRRSKPRGSARDAGALCKSHALLY